MANAWSLQLVFFMCLHWLLIACVSSVLEVCCQCLRWPHLGRDQSFIGVSFVVFHKTWVCVCVTGWSLAEDCPPSSWLHHQCGWPYKLQCTHTHHGSGCITHTHTHTYTHTYMACCHWCSSTAHSIQASNPTAPQHLIHVRNTVLYTWSIRQANCDCWTTILGAALQVHVYWCVC